MIEKIYQQQESVSISSSSSSSESSFTKKQRMHDSDDRFASGRSLSDDYDHDQPDERSGTNVDDTNLVFGIPCCRACRHLVERDHAGRDWTNSSEQQQRQEQQHSETALRLLSFRPGEHSSSGRPGSTTFTPCQVRQHNHVRSAWIVVGREIYDITLYLSSHPGGVNSLLSRAGGVRDCTRDFKFHSKQGQQAWEQFRMGRLVDCESDAAAPPSRSPWWMWNWNQ
ncbi:hypothetical protein ACA910_008447 [Epithemia clementina (nom. ined.)]